MNLDTIIKLLLSTNNEDCIIGYRLLRRKYRFMFLWMINLFILHKYDILVDFTYFPDIHGGSDERWLVIFGPNTQSWIQLN